MLNKKVLRLFEPSGYGDDCFLKILRTWAMVDASSGYWLHRKAQNYMDLNWLCLEDKGNVHSTRILSEKYVRATEEMFHLFRLELWKWSVWCKYWCDWVAVLLMAWINGSSSLPSTVYTSLEELEQDSWQLLQPEFYPKALESQKECFETCWEEEILAFFNRLEWEEDTNLHL